MKTGVHAGWTGWRRMSGVICNRRVPARVKGKVYRVAVRPAMLYGLETVALTKRQEAEMEVAELKIFIRSARMDKIRNENIRGISRVGRFGDKTRVARLKWSGHVWRKDDRCTLRKMLRMELPGKRKRGRFTTRFMVAMTEDVTVVDVTEEDAEDRNKWRRQIVLCRVSKDVLCATVSRLGFRDECCHKPYNTGCGEHSKAR